MVIVDYFCYYHIPCSISSSLNMIIDYWHLPTTIPFYIYSISSPKSLITIHMISYYLYLCRIVCRMFSGRVIFCILGCCSVCLSSIRAAMMIWILIIMVIVSNCYCGRGIGIIALCLYLLDYLFCL